MSGNEKGKLPITIIVNSREKEVNEHQITYEDIIRLAFAKVEVGETIEYSVSYSKGQSDKKGFLFPGDFITVIDGMIFNVTKTNKS